MPVIGDAMRIRWRHCYELELSWKVASIQKPIMTSVNLFHIYFTVMHDNHIPNNHILQHFFWRTPSWMVALCHPVRHHRQETANLQPESQTPHNETPLWGDGHRRRWGYMPPWGYQVWPVAVVGPTGGAGYRFVFWLRRPEPCSKPGSDLSLIDACNIYGVSLTSIST